MLVLGWKAQILIISQSVFDYDKLRVLYSDYDGVNQMSLGAMCTNSVSSFHYTHLWHGTLKIAFIINTITGIRMFRRTF